MRNRDFYSKHPHYHEHRQRNRVFFGIALALIGIALMLKTMGILPYFTLEYSWPIVLIIIGLLIGIKSGFRRNAWWILIAVGVAHVIPQFMIFGKPSSHYIWPAVLITAGVAIALRPRRQPEWPPKRRMGMGMETIISSDSTLNIDVAFGGKKEVVTTKDFKGGAVSVAFAGCELNLAQAEMTDSMAVLEFSVSFGGVEMVVPSHWEIQNEISHSFGSVEDERIIQTATAAENKKTLILRGSCSFGSIEIKSF